VKLIKIAKWVKYSVTAGLFLMLIIAMLFLYYLPEEKILRLFISQSELLLDRKVQIEDFRYTINGFRLNGVRILEKDGTTSYLQASAIEIKFRRRAFLERKIDISSFTIHNPVVRIDYTDEYSLEPIFRSISKNLKDFPFFVEGAPVPETILRNLTLEVKNTPDDLAPLRGTYLISTKIVFPPDRIEFKNLKLRMPETRGSITSDKLILTFMPNDFALKGDVFLYNCDISWTYLFDKTVKLPYRIANGQVRNLNVTGKYTEGSVEEVTCSLSNGNMVVAKKGYTRVTYAPLTLLLKDITATARQSARNDKSAITIGFIEVLLEKQLFKFDVGPVEGEFGDFLIMIPVFDLLPITGHLKGSLVFNGAAYTGDFDLKDFAYGTTLSGATFRFVMKENFFQLDGLRANLFGAPALISAKTLDKKLSSFALNMQYDSYTFNEKMSNEIALPPGLTVQGMIRAAEAHYKENHISDITLSYSISSDKLLVPRARCRMLGADIDGEATIALTGDAPKTTLFVRFFNLQAQNLGTYTEIIKNRLYGNASGQLRAEFYPGKNIPPVGALSFTVVNGKVVNTGFQNQLGFLLSPLKYKLEDLEFSHIYGNLLFDREGYHFSTFVFDAPEISLRVNGSVTTKMIGNLDITLQFTEAFIRDIPNIIYVAPQLSTHRRQGKYTYNFAIQDKDVFGKESVKMLP